MSSPIDAVLKPLTDKPLIFREIPSGLDDLTASPVKPINEPSNFAVIMVSERSGCGCCPSFLLHEVKMVKSKPSAKIYLLNFMMGLSRYYCYLYKVSINSKPTH